MRRPSAAIDTTTAIVTAAPANAVTQTAGSPPNDRQPKQIDTTAPSAAPLCTPSVNGVASASRNKAWKITPDIASAPPAKAANITLGILA